jgi:hypothetical protein
VYMNPNNSNDPDLINKENSLQRKMLGLDYNEEYGTDAFGNDLLDNIGDDDNSIDPIIYDTYTAAKLLDDNNDPNDDYKNGDPIINNTKVTLKPFVQEPEIEIVTDDTLIDYTEPTIN